MSSKFTNLEAIAHETFAEAAVSLKSVIEEKAKEMDCDVSELPLTAINSYLLYNIVTGYLDLYNQCILNKDITPTHKSKDLH